MALPSDALCSLADVKQALEDTGTGRDALIEALIVAASREILRESDREFAPVTSATRRFGWRSRLISLAPYDLASITSVTVHPESTTPYVLPGTEYLVHPVGKRDGVWTALQLSPLINRYSQTARDFGLALVDVAGTWGFPAVPEAIRRATVVAVMSWLRRDIGAFAMDVEGGREIPPMAEGTFALPPASHRFIAPFRRGVAI